MSLTSVDWTLIPSPADDGKTDHLVGYRLPDLDLTATDGATVNLSALSGITVVYIYPMTGRPDRDLPDGWNMIPGARGCTPQACSFRDHYGDLTSAGAQHLFGLSTQSRTDQSEAAGRLHLPFPLLSDADLAFGQALGLPGMQVGGHSLHKRLTMIARDGVIAKVFYPVFPPDQDAENVIAWLRRDADDRA